MKDCGGVEEVGGVVECVWIGEVDGGVPERYGGVE